MAGGIAFDWRGTPIKEGAKVVTHSQGEFAQRTIGIVDKVTEKSVTVRVLERSSTYHKAPKISLGHASVLVLTPDLFDEVSSDPAGRREWFAKPNDLIGGWCVMDVDATPSEAHRPAVADFTSEQVAKYIAILYNCRHRITLGEEVPNA